MTTTSTRHAPQFRTHSTLRATLRGTALVTLAAALAISFVAEVWSGPAHPEARASAVAAPTVHA